MNNEDYKELSNNLTDEVVDLRIENENLKKANKHITEQLNIAFVTFCLPEEGDDFEKWFFKHFFMNPDKTVVAIRNETIKYTQEQMLELWNFLTDRLLAN